MCERVCLSERESEGMDLIKFELSRITVLAQDVETGLLAWMM